MTVTSTRPLGISLLALLFLVLAILTLGMAGFVLVNPRSAQMYIDILERLQWSAAWTSLLAVPPLVTAGLAGLVFNGLWQQQDWARLATMVVVFLFSMVTIAALAFVSAFQLGASGSLIAGLVVLMACAIAFVYLLRTPLGDEKTAQSASSPVKLAAAAPPDPPVAQPYVERTASPAPPPYQPGAFVPPPPREPVQRQGSLDADTIAAASLTQQASTSSGIGRTATLIPQAWLVVQNGQQYGQQFPLHPDVVAIVGRDASRVDILITDPTVSSRHAQIRFEDGRFVLHDLGSTNGVSMGGQPLHRWPLQHGDEFSLGNARLTFVERID